MISSFFVCVRQMRSMPSIACNLFSFPFYSKMKPLKWFVSTTIKNNAESHFFFLRKIVLLNLFWNFFIQFDFISFEYMLWLSSSLWYVFCNTCRFYGFFSSSLLCLRLSFFATTCLSSFCLLTNYQSTITSYYFHQYTTSKQKKIHGQYAREEISDNEIIMQYYCFSDDTFWRFFGRCCCCCCCGIGIEHLKLPLQFVNDRHFLFFSHKMKLTKWI